MRRLNGYEIGLIVGGLLLLLLIAGCASTATKDVRAEHLLACEAYTSALEKVAMWKELGKLDAGEVALLQQVERNTTPLCMTPEPSANSAELVLRATEQLDKLLFDFLVEDEA